MQNQIEHTAKSVVMVDDDADTCLWLRDILAEDGAYRYLGSFNNAGAALANIPQMKPDLVLMDIGLPDINGIECTKHLRQIMSVLRIIMVTGRHDVNTINRSLQAGAIGYLVKPVTRDQCLATVRYAVAVSERCQMQVLDDKTATGQHASLLLTQRENLVMQYMAKGLLYKEIAEELKMSYSAVHKLQHKIFVKLKAANRTEAISKWREGIYKQY